MTNPSDDPAAQKRSFSKGDFYRLCREWHGYFSALAFLALIFFSATGILLNHPGLLRGKPADPIEQTFKLDTAQIAALRASAEPGKDLAKIAGAKIALSGAYSAGELDGDDVFVRMQGVRGTSDVRGNLMTGDVSVYVERETAVGVMNGLHRGEHAGDAWRLALDIVAGLLILTSVIGFVLFLSLRFRLRTMLVLTGLSIVAFAGLFMFATP